MAGIPKRPPPPYMASYASATEYSRPFFIHNSLNDKVLDVKGMNTSPGAKVNVYGRKKPEQNPYNQLWYADKTTGILRSKLNGFALESQNLQIIMKPFDPRHRNQQWVLGDKTIFSLLNSNQVLGCEGGFPVKESTYAGKANQHWYITYEEF